MKKTILIAILLAMCGICQAQKRFALVPVKPFIDDSCSFLGVDNTGGAGSDRRFKLPIKSNQYHKVFGTQQNGLSTNDTLNTDTLNGAVVVPHLASDSMYVKVDAAGNLYVDTIPASTTNPNIKASNDVRGTTLQYASNFVSYTPSGGAAIQTYRVGGYVNVLAASGPQLSFRVTFVDENNIGRTLCIYTVGNCSGGGGLYSTAIAYNSINPVTIRVKQNTPIVVTLIINSGSLTYDVGAWIEFLY